MMRRVDAVLLAIVLSLVLGGTAPAALVLGTGSGALLGGDLTDPDNNIDDNVAGNPPYFGTGYDWVAAYSNMETHFSPGGPSNEAALDLFDNKVGGSSDKWYDGGANAWVAVQFDMPYVLTHFTVASANDVPGRDPDIWRIQGSNDSTNGADGTWNDVFIYNNDGTSIWGATRLQVVLFESPLGPNAPAAGSEDYTIPNAYSWFRYQSNSVVNTGHQLSEIELFGVPGGDKLFWAGGNGNWGTPNWNGETAGSPPPPPDWPIYSPETGDLIVAVIDRPNTVTVEADHSASVLMIDQGDLIVGQDNSLAIAGPLEMAADTSVTLEPGARLSAGRVAGEVIEMKNNSQMTFSRGAIGEVNLTGSTGTIVTGGDLRIEGVTLPSLGTLVKSGAGVVTLDEIAATASSTVRIDEGSVTTPGSDDLQSVVLNGGQLTLTEPRVENAPGHVQWSQYNGGNSEANLRGIDDGVLNGQNGGLFNLTPSAEGVWTGNMDDPSGRGDNFALMWHGYIMPRTSGAHTFNMAADDWEALWIDLDRNGDFETTNAAGQSELIIDALPPLAWDVNGNNGTAGTVTLQSGQSYPFAAAYYEDAGGEWGWLKVTEPGGTEVFASPTDQPGMWGSPEVFPIDTNARISVTDDSTLELAASGIAQLGPLTLQEGILTIRGTVDVALFPSTTITVADGGQVGIAPDIEADFGTISASSVNANPQVQSFTFTKAGPSRWAVGPGTFAAGSMAKATFDAHEGTLAMVGSEAWAGSRHLQLSGGTATIEPGAGTLAYWSLDDADNLGHDDSGSGHDLELLGGPTYFKSGQVGGAMRFDDTRHTQAVDYDAAQYLNGLDEVTIAMWIKADQSGVDRGFWQLRPQLGEDQWGARYDAEGAAGGGTNVIKAAVTTTASGGTANRGADQQESRSNVQTTNWQHVAITWKNGDGFKMYLDGIEDFSPTSRMTNQYGRLDMVNYFMLGRGGKNEEWRGLIDEVYITNYALSAAEINAMKNGSFVVQPPELPDLSGVAVTVTEPSTLSVGGDGLSTMQFGPLTMNDDAILTTEGGPVAFNRLDPGDPADTTIAAGAEAVGFDARSDMHLGAINGNNAPAMITKVGPGDLLVEQPGSGLDLATFDVREGRLIGVSSTASPFGGAAVQVSDGELLLTGRAGESSARFDNIVFSEGGTLTAGTGSVGPDGPLTVTLGGATLDGVLDLRSTDGYTLDVQGVVDGTGGPRVTEGTVILSGEIDAGFLGVAGGSLTTPIGGAVGRLMLAGGTLTTGADLNADTAAVTGGTLLLGNNDLVINQRMTVGQVRYGITSGPPIIAAGSDLISAMDLTLAGGTLSITGLGADAMPQGLQLWLDADDDDTLFRDTAGMIPVTADGQEVARWNNKGGNGPDVSEASNNTPTYVASVASLNGAPALHFDADVLRATNTTGILANDDRTVISVWANAENTGQNYQHTFHMGNAATNQAYGHSVSRAIGAGEIGNHYWGDGFDATPVGGLGGPVLAISTWDGDGGTNGNGLDSWWVNGNPAGASDRAGLDTGDSQLTIGSRLNPVTEGIRGDIAEVLVFDRVLSNEELQAVGGYLADKYGLTTPYTGGPLGSPVDQRTVNLVVTADSRLDSRAPAVNLGNLSIRNTAADAPTTLTISNTSCSFQDVTADDGAMIVGELVVRGTLHPNGEAPLWPTTAEVNPTLRHGTFEEHIGTLKLAGYPELIVERDGQGNVVSSSTAVFEILGPQQHDKIVLTGTQTIDSEMVLDGNVSIRGVGVVWEGGMPQGHIASTDPGNVPPDPVTLTLIEAENSPINLLAGMFDPPEAFPPGDWAPLGGGLHVGKGIFNMDAHPVLDMTVPVFDEDKPGKLLWLEIGRQNPAGQPNPEEMWGLRYYPVDTSDATNLTLGFQTKVTDANGLTYHLIDIGLLPDDQPAYYIDPADELPKPFRNPPAPGSVPEIENFSKVTGDFFIALSGDANGDGAVNGLDVGIMAGNWTGHQFNPTPDKTWTQGDVAGGPYDRGDGQVNLFDFMALLENFNRADPGVTDGSATAVYDPATGEFSVSVDGVTAWALSADGGLDGADVADVAAALSSSEGTLVSANTDAVGEGSLGGLLYGDLELGQLVTPGTDPSTITFEYVTGFGSQRVQGTIAVVPEPGTVIMLLSGLLGALLLIRRRRKR